MTEAKVMQATNIFVFHDRHKNSTILNPKCLPRQNKHMTGWKQEKRSNNSNEVCFTSLT